MALVGDLVAEPRGLVLALLVGLIAVTLPYGYGVALAVGAVLARVPKGLLLSDLPMTRVGPEWTLPSQRRLSWPVCRLWQSGSWGMVVGAGITSAIGAFSHETTPSRARL